MIILGVDPGTATTGFGLVKKDRNNVTPIDYGCILTPAKKHLAERLEIIYKDLREIITKYKPDAVAVEDIFFCKNLKTAINVSQARGVILLAGRQEKIPVCNYTPLQVKQSVCGYGRASKSQVQKMVKILLDLKKIPKPDDAADALAIALCHAQSEKCKRLMT